MAKITVSDRTVTITSSLKLKDLEKVCQYAPEATTLYGGKDGDVPKFKVAVGGEALGSAGVSFCRADYNGYAVISTELPPCENTPEAIKTAVAEMYGFFLGNLGEVEENIAKAVETVNARHEEAKASVTLMGEAAGTPQE